MSETWRVIDDKGAAHEVEADVADGCRRKTTIRTATGTNSDYVSTQYPTRAAVAMTAGWQFIAVAEVLAPGQAPRAQAIADAFGRGADLQRGLIRAFAVSADPAEVDAVMSPMMPDDLGAEVPARRLLDAVRDVLGPTCADAAHEALPSIVAEVVACDAEMHREVDARGERLRALRAVAQAAATLVLWHDANTPDGYLNDADGHLWSMIDALRAAGYEMPTGAPTGPTREEMAAEVAHLEARRGALLAEVDRLTARDRDAGVVIEDLRKMLAAADADLAAARDDAATARADGAREMRERAAAVADRCADERGGTQARLLAAGVVDGAMVAGIKGGEATRIEEAIRALPLPGEEVARG